MVRKHNYEAQRPRASSAAFPIRCRIRAEGGVTRLDIFDEVGADSWGGGLSAADVAGRLSGLRGPLDVHVNSAGGDVGEGLGVYNTIRGYQGGRKRTIVDGYAASIASVIVQAGDERIVEQGGLVMVHNPFTGVVGDADDLRKMADVLDKHASNLAEIYARRAGGTVAHWREVMKGETWFTAAEAVGAGLADRVGDGAASLPSGPAAEQLAARAPFRIAARLRAAAAPDDDEIDGTPCRTCDGRGRLRHPATGKNSQICPSCDGTGTLPPDEFFVAPGGGAQGRQGVTLTAEQLRILRGNLPPLTTDSKGAKR